MATRTDRWQPRYIDTTAVGASGTTTGPNLLLDGAVGVAVQVICSGGAAGTAYIDCTNQDGVGSAFVTPYNAVINANGSAYFTFALTDQVTSFSQLRVRFVSSAAGNINVATNIRRTAP